MEKSNLFLALCYIFITMTFSISLYFAYLISRLTGDLESFHNKMVEKISAIRDELHKKNNIELGNFNNKFVEQTLNHIDKVIEEKISNKSIQIVTNTASKVKREH